MERKNSSRQPEAGLRHVSDSQPGSHRATHPRREEIDLSRRAALARAAQRDLARTDVGGRSVPCAYERYDFERAHPAVRRCHRKRVETELADRADELQQGARV